MLADKPKSEVAQPSTDTGRRFADLLEHFGGITFDESNRMQQGRHQYFARAAVLTAKHTATQRVEADNTRGLLPREHATAAHTTGGQRRQKPEGVQQPKFKLPQRSRLRRMLDDRGERGLDNAKHQRVVDIHANEFIGQLTHIRDIGKPG